MRIVRVPHKPHFSAKLLLQHRVDTTGRPVTSLKWFFSESAWMILPTSAAPSAATWSGSRVNCAEYSKIQSKFVATRSPADL